jgi:AraC-like DNA-binding protein
VTGGLTFLVSPSRDYIGRRLGLFLLAGGFLFSLSAFDSEARIPFAISNFLVLAALFALCWALIDIVVYLFSEDPPPIVRPIKLVGLAWTLLVWLLPFVDHFLGLGAVTRSVEDGSALGPFHAFAAYAIYAWPIAVIVILFAICRMGLRAIDLARPGTRFFGFGSIILILSLASILAGGISGSRLLYRAGHSVLEALLLVWYFVALARPALFSRARETIREEREELILRDPREAALIEERVEKAVSDPAVLGDPELDLRALAEIVKVPPYRLSNWLNSCRQTSFSAWLNAERIRRVQALMLEYPEKTILELSMEAGYASKSVFNEQFRRIAGVSPSEWRRSPRADKP